MTAFVRCSNCGRYAERERAVQGAYCSVECVRRYTQCSTCGRYFERPEAGEVRYCSSECAAGYTVKINPEIRNYLREAS